MDETISAAERQARADDRRIVIAAHNAGKIPSSRIEFWCEAMQKDRAGNRAIIAALAPVPRTASTVEARPTSRYRQPPNAAAIPEVAAADEALYNEVAWKMGHRAGIEPPNQQVTYFHDSSAPYVAMNPDGTGQWVDPGQEQREESMREQALREQAKVEQQEQREIEARAAYRADKDRMGGLL